MSRHGRPVIIVTACLLLSACGGDTSEPSDRFGGMVFDTVRVIGSLDGDDREVFGRITGVDVSEQGEIAILDVQLPKVTVFGPDGEFAASLTAHGEGPGELNQPWSLAWIGDGELLVADRGNARLSRFVLDGPDLQYAGSIPMEFPMEHLCTIGEDVFVAAYREEGMIHRFDWEIEDRESFGAVPDIASVEGMEGMFRDLARRQWTVGRLMCEESADQVLEVGVLNGNVRLFTGDGETVWQDRLGDVHMMEPVVENGSFSGRPDEVTGAHVAQSTFLWDREHVLVQYERRFPEDAGDQSEPELDSRLIHLETGTEEARTDALPRFVGRSGDQFLKVRNEPYPRLLILERSSSDGEG